MLILDTLRSYAGYLAYGFALLLLLLIPYRILLHPLRNVPGPLLAKLTDLYATSFALQKRLPVHVFQLHEQYGSAIRLAPNRVLFNTGTAFRAIYQNDDRITKSFTYELLTTNGVYSVFNTLDRDTHRGKRKIVSPAFSERSTKSFEPALMPKVDLHLKQLQSAGREPINMTKKMSHLAIDAVAELALGYNMETQTSAENRFFPEALTISFMMGNISHHFPFFFHMHNNRLFDWLFATTRANFLGLLTKMVQARLALDTHAKPDLFSFVAEAVPAAAEKTSDSAVWKEAMVFLAAGGDTVATALTAIFWYLSRNPDAYKRLAEEIRTKFSDGEDIRGGPLLASCQYLRACIDEALRMSPPISANLWRQQVSEDKEPLVIDGQFIPRGTLFGVNVYALSHNAEIFPEPFAFKPERWLPEGTGDQGGFDATTKKAMRESFASFSIGPRNCVGKPLAYLECSLVVAKTLWYFDFEKASGELGTVGEGHDRGRPDEFCTKDGFNSTHDGPYLVFTPREAVSVKDDLSAVAA